ncbi:hypothetical protein M972_11378 [Acetivibrio thermocellus AD2]|uniref:Uncharacterized protein n=1 Tax=Acetivibrio thermocellus AD2 TaxID=1138384 RepID=A0AB36TCC7_ACETH|nr:hypothetical protein Clo1313_0363 [Acetivibrio thermocellus DSM 1313]ALX07375.1 hypothetical protein AD2_00367 [Acetivibrio thermocellus AD2]ANV75113.1 hypothetical protein LQRI_0366 [Acetivibrio thermocellus DSM 2360]EIC04158.1 hypothetical protein YSBL_2032 [Acetivibrio thermocellus YS]SOD21270.1 hypothetical protein SAMN04515622_0058 [Acetivibrio thermocellus]
MKRCSNCNLEYMDESNVCSVCGGDLKRRIHKYLIRLYVKRIRHLKLF